MVQGKFFHSVSFQCHFGSCELVAFFIFENCLWFLVCVCVYVYVYIYTVRMSLNNNISWNKIVHMYIKTKHMNFFFLNVISLKFNFRSTQIALELQPLCLHWNTRIFTVRFSGGTSPSCCYVKGLHKQEWLTVTVVHVIKEMEGNSSRAVVFKCLKKSVLLLQALEGILNLTYLLKCWRRLTMIIQVTNFPMTGLFLSNLDL